MADFTVQQALSAMPPSVLAYLDRLFPPLAVTPATTLEEVMFVAGQRKVIEDLRAAKTAADKVMSAQSLPNPLFPFHKP